MTDVDVAIIGAGITGLSTAYFLHQADPTLKVAVFEHQSRSGGRIDSTKVESLEVELGADALVSREPIVPEVIESLGLSNQIVRQNVEHAMLYTDNELKFLPQKTALGLPVSWKDLKHTGLVSRSGIRKYRFLTRRNFDPVETDISLGTYVRQRMGDEVADNVVDPLLGSIHAGSIDRLSLRATAPQLAELAQKGGSIHNVVEPLSKAPRSPMFMSLAGGIPQLVEAFHQHLVSNGTPLTLSCGVNRIEDNKSTKTVVLSNGETISARDVVVATPSYVASELLRSIDAEASSLLESINHANVAMCILVYAKENVPELPDASGFLFGHDSLSLMTACSFASQKWERYNDGEHMVFRLSAGRADDVRAFSMSDKELVRHLHNDLSSILGINDVPRGATLRRWPRAFPQYTVGHLQKLDDIESSLAMSTPGVYLAGASYRGVGIPSCMRQAKRVAEKITA